MTDQAPSRSLARSLVRALQALLPQARIAILHERPWHSLTFNGAQICLSVALPITAAEQRSAVAQLLEDHEFSLPSQLVADIAITETAIFDGQYRLIIDALLLED
ncbi:MAG: hypothetical protein B7Y62_05165 [Sphingomonadales bacterium 35-56-22]|jgi:hypothetical protein|uniref:hypothetical protein n=1 Tax=Sphingorhabdus sp. TaxID=1902408 RepID=UPI000BCD1360|nr:hypothetical protein [Sphingorhabdus sp.]OYY15810.1 MAG: hypothetical protein B7Y62_05165 [Sphingomonadales bacterium 35-56-22]OYY97798.1 MAG: hypothetical protein B7Y38_05885 [Sphingomonadales bacterium 28-56-43]OYZ61354.1 MAG: hypothetical protein B7Y10_02685 [Sphingomonadales bacterium 24-56-14]OZA82723.1 MAG: hypothetical protein B7X66_07270 [Sphingomonadales bacterium 39-57-19]HQS12922.1 hypothetical protein [Sphingorhabdus sp.]